MKEKGFSLVAIVMAVALGLIVASALSYYVLSGDKTGGVATPTPTPPRPTNVVKVTPLSDDPAAIEKDLDEIEIGDIDEEIDTLDSDAATL